MCRVRLIFFAVASLSVVGFVGCGRTSTDGTEISRATSPDGRVDAVLIEVPTGATVPTPTELYVTPNGSKPVRYDLVLRADHVDNAALKWESEKLLAFGYSAARIYTFTNFWRSPAVDSNDYRVEITLKPTNIRSVR